MMIVAYKGIDGEYSIEGEVVAISKDIAVYQRPDGILTDAVASDLKYGVYDLPEDMDFKTFGQQRKYRIMEHAGLPAKMGAAIWTKFAALSDLRLWVLCKLFTTRYPNKFHQSLKDQIMVWAADPAPKFDTPLSKKQWEILLKDDREMGIATSKIENIIQYKEKMEVDGVLNYLSNDSI